MRGKKRKGASLSMVIIAMIVITIIVAVMASVITTANAQTLRMSQYLKAKYVATSGTQLALGAFHGEGGSNVPTALRSEFERRSNQPVVKSEPITASHQFAYQGNGYGTAEIEMTGDFLKDDQGKVISTSPTEYYVTIKSKAQIGDSQDYYVHTVVFNVYTNGIRSEKGGTEQGSN